MKAIVTPQFIPIYIMLDCESLLIIIKTGIGVVGNEDNVALCQEITVFDLLEHI